MNPMRKIYIMFALSVLLQSCKQSRISELESEKENLENKISTLESQLRVLKDENEDLKNYISQMENDMHQIKNFARSASSHASSATFWANNGDTFLYQSEIRNMSSDFNRIASIASKY
jgi:predicted  nucleic acid-binding Zn-ribbon protein